MLRSPRKSLVVAGALGLLFTPAATPSDVAFRSDPIGCYAVIDKVVIDDNGESDPTIMIWGVFALTDGAQGYYPAERGFLYFTMNRNERATKAEWADLKSVAGTGQVVGFGSRYDNLGRVYNPAEAQPRAVPYSNGWNGISRGHSVTRWAYDQVRSIPNPVSPAPNARVAAGAVTLVAKPAADKSLPVIFEIVGPDNIIERSAPLTTKTADISWTPKMELKAGGRYNWKVFTGSNPPALSTIYVNPTK